MMFVLDAQVEGRHPAEEMPFAELDVELGLPEGRGRACS